MNEPKRYDMIGVTRCGEAWQELQEEEFGEWVRYDDVEAQLRAAEQHIAVLTEALTLLEKYAPLSGDMALMIRASQSGGDVAHERANKLIEFYSHLDEAHDKARAALSRGEQP